MTFSFTGTGSVLKFFYNGHLGGSKKAVFYDKELPVYYQNKYIRALNILI